MAHELLDKELTEVKNEFWMYKVVKDLSAVEGDLTNLMLDPQQIYLLQNGYNLVITKCIEDKDGFTPTDTKIVLMGIRYRWSTLQAKNRLPYIDRIVEIGTSYGNNAWKMCMCLQPKECYLVDPYQDIPENVLDESCMLDKDAPYQFAKFMLEKLPVKPVFNKQKSNVAFADYPDNFFDFIYVDGDHSYEGCEEDIRLWWPKLKIGGIMAGDDYHKGGVKEAVEKHFKTYEISPNNYEWLINKDG